MTEHPSPWSVNATFGPGGLSVAGVGAEELATRYGTPLLVIDEDDFRARCRRFAAAFPRVLFAVKAFPSRTLIRAAVEEGLGLLVSTGGELHACLRAGADPAIISFHGNNKSQAELELALDMHVGIITVDNLSELHLLDELARARGTRQPVLLRIAPGVEGETHAYLETGGLDSKFGIPEFGDRALEAMRAASDATGIELLGIHAHVGSQLLHVEPYLNEVDRLFDLFAEARAALGLAVGLVDLGGGFGVTYTQEAPVEPEEASARILGAVKEAATARNLEVPDVMVEPGRALVANPVCTLYRVGAIKEVPSGTTYVAVDGGMSDNIRPALYGSRYAVASAGRPRAREDAVVTVVGKHCETGDVLAREVALSADLRQGDLLAFAATGAYGYAMASNYNRVGRPAVVAVRNGSARLVIRREDEADLDRLEVDLPEEPRIVRPEGVEVRPGRPRDAASFDRAWSAILEEGWVRSAPLPNPVRHYRTLFRDARTDHGLWLVAVAGGDVVGHLAITREEHPATRHIASLGLGVLAEWRGRGIGSTMIGDALAWARDVGVRKVILTVYPDNLPAVNLYRKFGFIEEGRFFRHSVRDGEYRDEILMGRWLG